MQLLTWLLIGLSSGWVMRTVLRDRRDFGLLGDLVTGTLGAELGGWVLRALQVTAPDSVAVHAVAALFGALVLLGVPRLLRQLLPATVPLSAPPLPADLDRYLAQLSSIERRVLAVVLRRAPVAQDPNQAFDASLTFGERLADRVAAFGGSWAFIGLFLVVMVGWMAVNQELARPFDPYPYILLNLALSCVAALQAPIIMMSQNRLAQRDRADARNDYEVNLRAEMQITALHEKLDAARSQEWARLIDLVHLQNERLTQLEQTLRASEPRRS